MKVNIGVLLAAGKGSRFANEIPKQLYPVNGKSIISYSSYIMAETLDKLVIVTNSTCFWQIATTIQKNTIVLINDVDCRFKSIEIALNYIAGLSDVGNIVIHDAARPFITPKHILNLLEVAKTHQYSQYFLKLVNGLAKKTEIGYETANRDEFIELCTPQIVNYNLFKSVFFNFIKTGLECEILPLTTSLEINYKLIEGSHKYLRKITTIDDIY